MSESFFANRFLYFEGSSGALFVFILIDNSGTYGPVNVHTLAWLSFAETSHFILSKHMHAAMPWGTVVLKRSHAMWLSAFES